MPLAAEIGSQLSQQEIEHLTLLRQRFQPSSTGVHENFLPSSELTQDEEERLRHVRQRLRAEVDGSHDDENYTLSQQAIFTDQRLQDTITHDLSRLDMLQYQFDQALGKKGPDGGIIRSYNPVLARWKFEQCTTPDEKEQFREYETLQIVTMLREMCRVESSTIQYAIDKGGRLRNELMPDEPFENVLLRGVAYRKKHNTPEPKREEKEVIGFLKVQNKLSDPNTPFGTRIVVISPPGIVKDSAYKDNFIDHYTKELDEQTGEVKVKMERIISPLDYNQTIKRIREIQPDFFKNYKGPLDAFFLEHPFEYYGEVADMEGMKRERYQRLIEGWMPFVDHLRESITGGSPLEIARSYNTLISIATEDIKQSTEDPKGKDGKVIYRNVQAEVSNRGNSVTKEQVAGCGRVESIDLQQDASSTNSNSVSKFGDMVRAENDQNMCNCGARDTHFHCEGMKDSPTEKDKEGNPIKIPCKKAIMVNRNITQCPDCPAKKIC